MNPPTNPCLHLGKGLVDTGTRCQLSHNSLVSSLKEYREGIELGTIVLSDLNAIAIVSAEPAIFVYYSDCL